MVSGKTLFSIGGGILIVALIIGATVYFSKPSTDEIVASNIAKHLDGRAVSLNYNQFWPFDSSHQIELTVLAKEFPDKNHLIVLADVKSVAPVEKTEEKEKFPTNKMQLQGLMRLYYERIGGKWYLLDMDNISLKAQFVP